jgi:hypothetical protein
MAQSISQIEPLVRKRIQHASRTIVLLESKETRKPECNLMAFDDTGVFVWDLHPPISPDADQYDGFVNIDLIEGKLFAWGWSGYEVKIDADTGRIEETLFTK